MEETWKKIEGYDNYEVSNYGNVRNIITGRDISQVDNYKGYKSVCLSNKGERKSFSVHKLVLDAFNPNTMTEKKYVIHKDGDNSNNYIDNLEYATHEEKRQYFKQPREMKKIESLIVKAVHDAIRKYSIETAIAEYENSERIEYR